MRIAAMSNNRSKSIKAISNYPKIWIKESASVFKPIFLSKQTSILSNKKQVHKHSKSIQAANDVNINHRHVKSTVNLIPALDTSADINISNSARLE